MTQKDLIQYHKWDKKEYLKLFKSINENFGLKSIQFYMPFYSLYFYIHNKPKANLKIDLQRNYYILNIRDKIKERYYNSNTILLIDVLNSSKNRIEEKECFCKCIPIVDPMHCLNNNYNFVNKTNYHLPSSYNHNTFSKINDIDNTAYIDVFCSYLFGNLSHNNILPSFAKYYGSANGIGNYNYDISEEYHDIKDYKSFNETIEKGFDLEIYVSDSDSDSDSDSESEIEDIIRSPMSILSNSSSNSSSKKSSNKSSNSSSKSDYNYINDDYIAKIKNIPLQYLFIERLEGTLEDLLDDDISEELLISCMFQISFSLTYLQKHYLFTHNDLHINNIMYENTDKEYLYYKYNNIYYKVPTYGKIFKIIDFGRAIFKYKNKVFMNDVFSKYGEAGGQYTYNPQVKYMQNNNKEYIKPNYNFDLCRLSMTILDELNKHNYSDNILDFLIKLCINEEKDINFLEMNDDFKLYISIAKNACNSLPRVIIQHDIFKKYRIKKKLFPRKSFYSI